MTAREQTIWTAIDRFGIPTALLGCVFVGILKPNNDAMLADRVQMRAENSRLLEVIERQEEHEADFVRLLGALKDDQAREAEILARLEARLALKASAPE